MQKALFMLLLTSCTTLVQVPITEPPEILLPPGPQEIVFISRFDTTQISFAKDKVTAVYKDGYQAFIKGLQEGFEAIEHLNLTLADTIILGRWYTSEAPKFPDSTQLLSIINQYEPDYLITLDAFKIELLNEDIIVDFGDGSSGRQVFYYIDALAAMGLFNQYGQVADKMLMNDQQDVEITFRGLFASTPDISLYEETVGSFAFDLGYQYALMFTEYGYFETRFMHSSKHFKQVLTLAKAGKWEDARKMLLPLTEHPDKKVAQKAAHNMSVIAEALGNRDEMDQWIEKAQNQ